ncbi:MAG: DUF3078 domain-containing protein [Alistipes indistinctus]
MRRFITLLLLLVLLGAANRSSAQFSISRVTPKEIDTKAMDDTIKPIAPINNRFFSEARYKAERRAIRKERNTVQINASAMFNLTGFENWYAGGDNVFASNLAFYFSHTYIKSKFNFQTTFDARYGINRISGKTLKRGRFRFQPEQFVGAEQELVLCCDIPVPQPVQQRVQITR